MTIPLLRKCWSYSCRFTVKCCFKSISLKLSSGIYSKFLMIIYFRCLFFNNTTSHRFCLLKCSHFLLRSWTCKHFPNKVNLRTLLWGFQVLRFVIRDEPHAKLISPCLILPSMGENICFNSYWFSSAAFPKRCVFYTHSTMATERKKNSAIILNYQFLKYPFCFYMAKHKGKILILLYLFQNATEKQMQIPQIIGFTSP